MCFRTSTFFSLPIFTHSVIDLVCRWMRLERLGLETADGLAPLPMQVSWVRDGILVVGMDNEMHVYTQWHVPGELGVQFSHTECPTLNRTIIELSHE